MEYIHVKNLEKYHPGYKDRKLIWAKIFFNMVQGDPDCEMIENETDWARLIKFIILELQAQKPIPLSDKYLIRKGFDLKKRSISLTIKELHEFIEIHQETVTEPLRSCNVEKSREEKKREDKEESFDTDLFPHFKNNDFKRNFNSYWLNRKDKPTDHAKELALKKLHNYDLQTAVKMLENTIMNGWKGLFELKENSYGKDRPSNRQPDEDAGKYDNIGTTV